MKIFRTVSYRRLSFVILRLAQNPHTACTTKNESISRHSEGAKRLRNLKKDPSGKDFQDNN
ncbi:MAG TPA: hypothetical protein GXZ27_07745 [Thermoanaerobacterales bacterium]|nr:hypothetical protein [Thermoanaerobacterales bacterium]